MDSIGTELTKPHTSLPNEAVPNPLPGDEIEIVPFMDEVYGINIFPFNEIIANDCKNEAELNTDTSKQILGGKKNKKYKTRKNKKYKTRKNIKKYKTRKNKKYKTRK